MAAPAFISTNQVLNIINDNQTNKDVIFVDTRQPEKYEAGSIEGAVSMHDIFSYLLPQSTESDLNAMKSHFTQLLKSNNINCSETEHIIIYEDNLNKLYGSSCRGYVIFKYLGHPNVSVLEGGYHGVLKLDESIQKQIKSVINDVDNKDCNVSFKYNEEYICGYQDVLNVVLGNSNAHLLDVRDEDEWQGLSSSPYGADFCPRKGRLPNAKWMEWYNFMDSDGLPKSKQAVEEIMNALNIQKEDDIIVYCFKGARASNSMMILNEYGYKNISNYFASWNEWSRNIELPIDDTVLASTK